MKSPGGWHYWFKYQDGLSNAARVNGLKDCDVRTDGGYIIAPPSINLEGDKYVWAIGTKKLSNIPKELYETLKSKPTQPTEVMSENEDVLSEGRRDNDIFRLCNSLMRGNMPEAEVRKYALIFAKQCGFSPEEAMIKVNSALKRDEQRGTGILTEDVRTWILDQQIGSFPINDLYNALQLSTRKEKQTLSKVLSRLCEGSEPLIERRKGGKAGTFEILEPTDDCKMNWKEAEGDPVDVFLPFGLHEMVETYPGNIIMVAGESNSGKTAFMLNILKDNMHAFDVHYFNSEMGSIELKKRLEKFDHQSIEDWNFSAYERSSDFHRIIKTGKEVINIIDFLEIYDNFYQVGNLIKQIHDRLDGAIAIIGIQKERNSLYGRGGAFGMEKPRLYLNMGNGEIEIAKAKNWVNPDENPNGCKMKFKLVQGHNFIQQGTGWVKDTG